MRPLLVPLLVLTAALPAGCMEGDRADTPAPPSLETPPIVAEETPEETPVPVEEAIMWDGKLSAQAIACAPVVLCVEHAGAGWFSSYQLAPHNWTHATLTLSWTSTVPGEVLVVWIAECASEPCEEQRHLSEKARGTSPLTLDMPILPRDSKLNATFILIVPAKRYDLSPAYARANLEQPFHVEGTFHGLRT